MKSDRFRCLLVCGNRQRVASQQSVKIRALTLTSGGSFCQSAAALNREKLLNDFYRYRRSAVEEVATEKIKAYILPRQGDTSAVDKLASLLHKQGVEVRRWKLL